MPSHSKFVLNRILSGLEPHSSLYWSPGGRRTHTDTPQILRAAHGSRHVCMQVCARVRTFDWVRTYWLDGSQHTHTRTHVAVGLMDSEEAKAEQANHVLLRHVKPWAVRFDDGERHTYTKEQMQEKFGITDIQPGQAVEHKVRGRGAVMPNETAEALKERKEMLMESLRDMESAPLPAAAAAALKYS